jgi:hypothetical protein
MVIGARLVASRWLACHGSMAETAGFTAETIRLDG